MLLGHIFVQCITGVAEMLCCCKCAILRYPTSLHCRPMWVCQGPHLLQAAGTTASLCGLVTDDTLLCALQSIQLSGGAIKVRCGADNSSPIEMRAVEDVPMSFSPHNGAAGPHTSDPSPLVMYSCYQVSASHTQQSFMISNVTKIVLGLSSWLSMQLSGKLQVPVEKLPSVVEVSFDTCFQSGATVDCKRLDANEQSTGQQAAFVAISGQHLQDKMPNMAAGVHLAVMMV